MRVPAVAALGLVLASRQPAVALQTALGPREPATRISGTVSDETGGVMWAAAVRVFADGSAEPVGETTTDRNGRFSVEVPAGSYRIRVSAPAFRSVDRLVHAVPGLEPLAVTLALEGLEESVDVVDTAGEFAIDALSNLTSTTLSGDELLGLPADEEDLAHYLLLLAGADSTGDLEGDVSGFIIDGFDEGRLPRPEEIAQIIIDPTPLRADGDGEGPRIEIITRPGTGRWRRSASFDFSDESLDATTPGDRTKPARQTRNVDLDLRGPILPGRLDVDVEASTNRQQRVADSLRAITPAGNVFDGVVRPRREHEPELDADIEVASNRSMGVRFDYRDPPNREQRRGRLHPGRTGHERRAARLVVPGQRTKAGRSVRQRPAGSDETTRLERGRSSRPVSRRATTGTTVCRRTTTTARSTSPVCTTIAARPASPA